MTKELNKFEIASIKRTYNNVKRLYTKRDKIQAAIDAKRDELQVILDEIEMWETPVVKKYGMTSEQILNFTPQEVEVEEPNVVVNPNADDVCEEDVTPETPAVATNDTPWN